ncbi:hypothetical protein GCM10023189_50150 [Nibrella saemangeumensis]|uniref:Uncharacterized protein n=2 Tax=Nibrella saemangeumensis TaxID=1084526 RepID=A0ABP8NJX3_9BACT
MTAGSLVPPPPPHYNSDQVFFDYYANSYDGFILATSVSTIALLFFLGYLYGMSQTLRRQLGNDALLPTVMQGLGLVATMLLLLAQACVSVEARVAHYKGSGAVIRGIDEVGHVSAHLFSYPIAAFLLLAAIGTFQSRLTARWVSIWAGLVSVALFATAGTFESQHILHQAGGLSLMMFILWIIASSLHLFWRIYRSPRPQA